MTMIGIEPHKATHTAIAINDNEHVRDESNSERQQPKENGSANGLTGSRNENGQSNQPTVSATSFPNNSSPPARPSSTSHQCSRRVLG